MKKVCRFCTHYRPNEKYRGVIGMCAENDSCTDPSKTCDNFKTGKQYWMCGEEVK